MVRTPVLAAFRQLQAVLDRGQLASLTDGDLLGHFRSARDDAAFALLVERHGRLVWSVCRQILRHEQDAEDCYQASFLVLARHADSIRGGQTVACWLYRVASRIARKAAMDRARRRRHEHAGAHAPVGRVADDVSWRELREVVHEEASRLSEKYRAPFVLCCLDGKSKVEASRQLGWKEGTVSSRLAHARKLVQRRLTRRGIALSAGLWATGLFLQAEASPAALARSTANAALWLRAGRRINELASPRVITLVQGASRTMAFSTLSKCIPVVLALCLVGTGSWALAWQRHSPEAPSRDAPLALSSQAYEVEDADTDPESQAPASAPGKPWIGFASRETNAGPELSILCQDGIRRTFQAAADTVLLSYLPDQPLGSHETLSVDLADSNRVLLRFDWPQGATTEKAELVLTRSQNRHPYPSQPITLAFHRVTEAWNESTTTWTRQPAFTRKPALTARIDPSAKEYRIDVTRLVRLEDELQGPRYGWLIRIAHPVAREEAKGEGGCPPRWSCFGQEYSYALDGSIKHGGAQSCRIESRGARPSGFAMLSQTVRADDYRGQRVRFSGYIKTDGLDGMATLWMRIDGENELLAIDKTVQQAVRGTSEWQQAQIVLDIPDASKTIRFAALVEGSGKAWVDDMKLEAVDPSVPVTNPSVHVPTKKAKPTLPPRPLNLDFEDNPE
jgi:RNA polymerase sigma factor (sigma-70 family)